MTAILAAALPALVSAEAASRADKLLARMTLAEKLSIVRAFPGFPNEGRAKAPAALGSAGYQPGIPRLRIPAIQQSDAGQGVGWLGSMPWTRFATALPSTVSVAATFDPEVARRGGAMIGAEARAYGFGMLLAGGTNLSRDPRGGRNFEYVGEDSWLAGVMSGAMIKGIQSANVMSTIKHFVLNAQETGRTVLSADIDEAALRESDLLAFELAIERGNPAAVMTSYNRLNGVYTAENANLLSTLRHDWAYRGFVMPDWGGQHSTIPSALVGLDQESSSSFDDQKAWYGTPLRAAIAAGKVPRKRLNQMVRRILSAMERTGTLDPLIPHAINFAADGRISQAAAEAGAVLLKNQGNLLPLAKSAQSIAVIGGHADIGVMSGGGSGQVVGPAGIALKTEHNEQPDEIVLKSSPLAAIRALAPAVSLRFASGVNPSAAAAVAAGADVAIVFVEQWTSENLDVPNLQLPGGQDALIAAVARANSRTIVVLETGGPVAMPWMEQVPTILECWYPGSNGGAAIARLLFGDAEPSGRLPISFPIDETQLPRPNLDGLALPKGTPFHVNYRIEGADIGYRWFARRKLRPLFPFGHGLGYTRFHYSDLKVSGFQVSFDVANVGDRAGTDTPQIYVTGSDPIRLVGFSKVRLAPGASARVQMTIDPRLLARWDDLHHEWQVAPTPRIVSLGASSADLKLRAALQVSAQRLNP